MIKTTKKIRGDYVYSLNKFVMNRLDLMSKIHLRSYIEKYVFFSSNIRIVQSDLKSRKSVCKILFFILCFTLLTCPVNAETFQNVAVVSHVSNGDFEEWSSGATSVAPDFWNKFSTGSNGLSRSTDSVLGAYSLRITGNSGEEQRGRIYQSVNDGENYTKMSFWIKTSGMTQGAVEFVFWDGATATYRYVEGNMNWTYYEFDIPYNTDYSFADVEIGTSGYLNTGATVLIDGFTLSRGDYLTEESSDSTHLYQTSYYTQSSMYPSSFFITQFYDFDLEAYNITDISVKIDGNVVDYELVDGYFFVDASWQSAEDLHWVDIEITFDDVGTYPAEQVISWCGIDWWARSGVGDPLDNSWNPHSVYIDPNGYLHLKIKEHNGTWYSSEIDAIDTTYLYGDFTWVVDGSVFNIDRDVVFGMYTYNDDLNENDIEITKWWDVYNDNLWFTVQAINLSSNGSSHPVSVYYPDGEPVTVTVSWRPEYMKFTAINKNGNKLAEFIYYDKTNISHVYQGIGMNLWQKAHPTHNQDIDVTIYSFSYTPFETY